MIPALLQRARALAAVAATVFAGCVGGGDTTPDASADGGRAIALELDAYSLAEVDVARVSVTASVRTEAPQALATVLGTWYLRVGSARVVATFAWSPSRGSLDASMQREGDAVLVGSTPLTVDGWNDAGELRFHRDLNDGDVEWYRVRAVDGVMTGRVATQSKLAAVPAITAYSTHVTGWNGDVIDRELVPRAWDLTLEGGARATLRIDRAVDGLTEYAGTLKVYATAARGIADEELEHDVSVLRWDGTHLEFYLMEGDLRRYYIAEVNGRHISGTWIEADDDTEQTWTGERRDVLGYGLAPRPIAEREAWQARARRQIAQLMMAGAPAPTATTLTSVSIDADPIADGDPWLARDDSATLYPRDYRLSELRLSYSLPNPYGATALSRQVHAYVARPTAPAPSTGRPVAIAVNGHWGSAWQVMAPNSFYWYGDSFARQGYLVVAVDASHRPLADRATRYSDMTTGDDVLHGNGPHPAIAAPGMSTDWEEDGERAWDVMRALDYALSLPDVDPSRVVLVGLSMGGEVVSLAGALDTRVTAVVTAGFSPDTAVFQYRHHGCWEWAWANVNEYVDTSDYHALVAPRALVVETGRLDNTFSIYPEPFASDKQVLRRSRAAFADAPERVLHYLHYDAHNFHVGGVGSAAVLERGVRVPLAIAPVTRWSLDWQDDAMTRVVSPTLFDTLGALLR